MSSPWVISILLQHCLIYTYKFTTIRPSKGHHSIYIEAPTPWTANKSARITIASSSTIDRSSTDNFKWSGAIGLATSGISNCSDPGLKQIKDFNIAHKRNNTFLFISYHLQSSTCPLVGTSSSKANNVKQVTICGRNIIWDAGSTDLIVECQGLPESDDGDVIAREVVVLMIDNLCMQKKF